MTRSLRQIEQDLRRLLWSIRVVVRLLPTTFSPSQQPRYTMFVEENSDGNRYYCQHCSDDYQLPYVSTDAQAARAIGAKIKETSTEDCSDKCAW